MSLKDGGMVSGHRVLPGLVSEDTTDSMLSEKAIGKVEVIDLRPGNWLITLKIFKGGIDDRLLTSICPPDRFLAQ